MANGKITLGKQSGGTLGLVFPDGVSDTEVVLPESGNIVSVDTAVTDNAIARYDGTTGKLQNSGVIIDDSGNIGIGAVPNNSRVYIEQLNASNNALAIFHNSNLQTQKIVSISNGVNGGTEVLKVDGAGNLLLTSGTGVLGYGTGAGGIVTQLTSKSTAVTLNKPTGYIVMNNAPLASGARVVFTLNNSLITNMDLIHVTIGDHQKYSVEAGCGPGSAEIVLRNVSTSSFSDSVRINFSIIKGSNA